MPQRHNAEGWCGFTSPAFFLRMNQGIFHMFQWLRANQNQTNKEERGVSRQEISNILIPTYLHQFPKSKPAEPNFFPFQIWWKNILTQPRPYVPIFSSEGIFGCQRENGSYRFIVEVPSQNYLSWAGRVLQLKRASCCNHN